jgi:hypothetical protein
MQEIKKRIDKLTLLELINLESYIYQCKNKFHKYHNPYDCGSNQIINSTLDYYLDPSYEHPLNSHMQDRSHQENPLLQRTINYSNPKKKHEHIENSRMENFNLYQPSFWSDMPRGGISTRTNQILKKE